MTSREKNDDIALVRNCIARDGVAWNEFFRRFKPVITGRINQVFFRYGFSASTADQQDAFDAVVDHLLYGKGLKGFSRDESLEAYVRTVTSRAVIDWYRARNAAKNLHGATIGTVLSGEGTVGEVQSVEETSSDEGMQGFKTAALTENEKLMLAVLLCRTRDITDQDLEGIMKASGKSLSLCEDAIRALRDELNNRWDVYQEKYESLQRLWVQMTVLERRGDKARFEKRKSQYDKQLAEYRKKGIEPFPTRKDLAIVLNWDINKVDRVYRKLEESLSMQQLESESAGNISMVS